jgi:hypothetical protein
MATQKKLGDRGVSQWQRLETPGDVKRFLRWVILSVRSQTLDTKVAGVYSQLAMALLKATQDSDFEERLTALEDALRATHQ